MSALERMWAIRDSSLLVPAKAVAYALASRLDRHGAAFVSVQKLARDAGYRDVRVVRTALAELVSKGIVVRTERPGRVPLFSFDDTRLEALAKSAPLAPEATPTPGLARQGSHPKHPSPPRSPAPDAGRQGTPHPGGQSKRISEEDFLRGDARAKKKSSGKKQKRVLAIDDFATEIASWKARGYDVRRSIEKALQHFPGPRVESWLRPRVADWIDQDCKRGTLRADAEKPSIMVDDAKATEAAMRKRVAQREDEQCRCGHVEHVGPCGNASCTCRRFSPAPKHAHESRALAGAAE